MSTLSSDEQLCQCGLTPIACSESPCAEPNPRFRTPRDPLLDGLCDHGLRIEDCELGCKKRYGMVLEECICPMGQRLSSCPIHGADKDDGVFRMTAAVRPSDPKCAPCEHWYIFPGICARCGATAPQREAPWRM